MADVDPTKIKRVTDFLVELEKGGALFRAWRTDKRAALDSTGLPGPLKDMIMKADQTNDLRPIREQVRQEQGGSVVVCLYVK
jgi:hypothetical protein